MQNDNFIFTILALFTIIPHTLAWFYMVICYRDSRLRRKILNS